MERSASYISRIFHLRPGDFAKGLPLFCYYFLIVMFYTMARVARDAICLDHFSSAQLPYADMSIGVLAGFVLAPYIRAGSRTSLRTLQIYSLLFFDLNLIAFWWGFHFHTWTWLAAVFYVWVGICGILSVAQVWTLANFVWTTREAKRLFAMLGSGGIIGGSIGGFWAKQIVKRLGTNAMLLFMAGLLAMCTALIWIIWEQRTARTHETAADDSQTPRNLLASFRLVCQSSHLLAIAALFLLSSVVTTVGSWQLKDLAKATLIQKD